MFHRLMGGAVLADRDTVMGKYISHRQFHQGCQTNGRAAIVGEHQKSAAVWTNSTVQCHTGQNGAHGVLPHTKTNIAAAICPFLKIER